jgi:hypothetical protein
MAIPTLLTCIALLGSVVMLVQHRPVGFPVVAVVASALEALMAFGLVHMQVARVPLGLVLGAALVVAGVAVYIRAGGKSVVSAATAVVMVGAIQVYMALK